MKCPKCLTNIPANHLNARRDIGDCPNCKFIFTPSEFSRTDDLITDSNGFNINNTPERISIYFQGNTTTLQANISSPIALFLVPFMALCTYAIVNGLYLSQWYQGKFSLSLSLVGIPFLLAILYAWGITLLSMAGKIVISINPDQLTLFKGVGKIGITNHIDLEKIDSVKEQTTPLYDDHSFTGHTTMYRSILLKGLKTTKSIGIGLNEEQHQYLLKALQKIIPDKKSWL